jgi:hypothetical protein
MSINRPLYQAKIKSSLVIFTKVIGINIQIVVRIQLPELHIYYIKVFVREKVINLVI